MFRRNGKKGGDRRDPMQELSGGNLQYSVAGRQPDRLAA